MRSTGLFFCVLALAAACQRARQPTLRETIQMGSGHSAVAVDVATSGARTLTADDKAFVRAALAMGMGEVELATAVRGRSRNQDVRQLATNIVDDFNRIDAEMTNLAYARSVSLPANVAPQLDVARRRMLADPMNLDRRYLEAVIESYADLLERYGAVTERTPDRDLKKIAAPAVETLQAHLRRAEMIRDALGSS